jgi:hypothetical protein
MKWIDSILDTILWRKHVSAGHYNIYVKVSGGHFELEDTIKCYICRSTLKKYGHSVK